MRKKDEIRTTIGAEYIGRRELCPAKYQQWEAMPDEGVYACAVTYWTKGPLHGRPS